jgi:hypothetical protein
MIVKKDSDDDHTLLRRSGMSGYSKKRGFYRLEEFDEKTHPQRLPAWTTRLSPADFKFTRKVNQEYFLVNFDAAAFIGMKEPVTVIPYENWDSSSFKSAYAVESLASEADFWDLVRSAVQWPGVEELGLSESEFRVYTEYGGDERIRAFAEEITGEYDRYCDKVWLVYDRLKYGEYRYGLKPGIAPDGDQLGWFLFHSKKGYCSYYAFAMTLLLRSLGIPARVAAGFFIDPETNTFDYYPVRSDMAHAWVEVAFPGYGWIEFDPTSENLAEDEEFSFSSGVDPALFEKLMREILENRSRMRPRTGPEEDSPASNFDLLARNAIAFLRTYWPPVLLTVLAALFLCIRCGFLFSVFLTRNPRRRSIRLMRHARQRLSLAGIRRPAQFAESEWSLRIDSSIEGIYAMYQAAAAARFAPAYSVEDFTLQRINYRSFSASYRKKIPAWRRIISWVFPPLALALGPEKNKKGCKDPAL